MNIAVEGSPTAGTDNANPTILIGPFSKDVFSTGIPTAFVTTMIKPHKHHGSKHTHTGAIATGASNIFINGRPAGVAFLPGSISCGDTIVTGVPTIVVGIE